MAPKEKYMTKRTVMIVLAAAALLIGASASRESAKEGGVFPWCPPFCSK
jgi:hypothetical protein